MKIISRYVLKEHVGPFVFAQSALTSLLLLQYIARRFGDLVGKGLSWQVISEFLLLSVPFTIAMTVPMAVLVAVLYAFTRLASENEITALKAGGVSSRSLMVPTLISATLLAGLMLAFNDQVLPRANHRLASLQLDILRTKPTFALRPQVINAIREGQLYLRAGQIDEESGHLHDVVIYDLVSSLRRRTIYGDSGILMLARNQRDLTMHLFTGYVLWTETEHPGQVSRLYYKEQELTVRDVANEFKESNADTTSKGEREMSICEMQVEYVKATADFRRAEAERDSFFKTEKTPKQPPPSIGWVRPPRSARGIGALYCSMLKKLEPVKTLASVRDLHAAELPQDTTKRPPTIAPVPPQQPSSVWVLLGVQRLLVPRDKIPAGAFLAPAAPPSATIPPRAAVPVRVPSVTPGIAPSTGAIGASANLADADIRLMEARRRQNRYAVEIQKKFSLAAACVVFALVGAPIALRFPRGGVGLVIGASFVVFATYYVGLIGGEELANRSLLSPFWAMWAANVIFLVVGIALMARMGYETATSRGGDWAQVVDAARAWFARQRRRGDRGARRSGR